jgi:hypothetical protein
MPCVWSCRFPPAQVYAYVNAYAEANPNNPDALWRLARACHDMAVLADDKAEKRAYVYRAYELAKQVCMAH